MDGFGLTVLTYGVMLRLDTRVEGLRDSESHWPCLNQPTPPCQNAGGRRGPVIRSLRRCGTDDLETGSLVPIVPWKRRYQPNRPGGGALLFSGSE